MRGGAQEGGRMHASAWRGVSEGGGHMQAHGGGVSDAGGDTLFIFWGDQKACENLRGSVRVRP